jgi:hypothetical protein
MDGWTKRQKDGQTTDMQAYSDVWTEIQTETQMD